MDARTLTEQHRLAQLALRARSLSDFTKLWPMWQAANPDTFQSFALAAIPLIRAYRQLSASVAVAYYRAFRTAEMVAGVTVPQSAGAITEAEILASIYSTGDAMNRRALRAGKDAADARTQALVSASGAVGRHVLDGGRDTILQTVIADPEAIGWARITDGNPCYFCLTLASRGAVYKTEQTAGFEAHDHCGCSAMPVFKGTRIPNLDKWLGIYNDAQQRGLDTGQLQHGENSSKARLNAVRQYLAQQ